jgi:surface antigen
MQWTLEKTKRAAALGFVLLALNACQTDRIGLDKATAGAGLGGALGGLLGSQFGSGQGRILAVGTGVLAGAVIGNRIGAYLDEQDRLKAAAATRQALLTGRPQDWSSESGASGQAEVVESTKAPRTVAMPVLKDRVQQVPPLDLIGETYVANGDVNVRGGPGTDYLVVGKLDAREAVTVAGRVQGRDWYMVSQGGAGSGFVHSSLLRPAPAGTPETAVASAEPTETMSITATQTCRTILQTVRLADGAEHQEEVTACQGPNGWEVV